MRPKSYVYLSGVLGMKSSGSFTRDASQWMRFNADEVSRFATTRPYGATRDGVFVEARR